MPLRSLYKRSVCFSCVSKYITRSVKALVVHRKGKTAFLNMAKTHKNLKVKVISLCNLYDAYEKAAANNREADDHLDFRENLGANLIQLKQELDTETYKRGDHEFFPVLERKKRTAANLPFRDKVVQHAVNNIVEPIFDKIFYPCSYSCRTGKGTHKGVIDVQATIRRVEKKHGVARYLKTDYRKFFPSVNLRILFTEIRRKISDGWLLRLLWHLAQNIKGGIIIGDLLSQVKSNIYGHILDRFAKTRLKIKHYFRYADDAVVIHHCAKYLRIIKRKIQIFSYLYMRMTFSKWQIDKTNRKPLDFLGYRITARYKLLRKDSVTNAKRKIAHYKKTGQHEKLRMFLGSWLGHARWADSANLINHLEKEYAIN